jgi:alpha-beta hydrolase superfamily lysophospholipase
VAKLREDGLAGPLFVVGHSMGGLIAALWGLSHGREAAGFVLSSPYLRLAVEPPAVKVLAARLLGRVVPWLPVAAGLDVADLTSDEEMRRWTDRDPLYGRATTPRWFDEAGRAHEEVLRRAAEFQAPLLVVAAGADAVADVETTRRWYAEVGSADKGLHVYEGFRHEIFNEVERHRPIEAVVTWISQRVPR